MSRRLKHRELSSLTPHVGVIIRGARLGFGWCPEIGGLLATQTSRTRFDDDAVQPD